MKKLAVSEIILKWTAANQYPWKIAKDITVLTPKLFKDIIIPKGFTTDLASVPKILWSIAPPYGKFLPAAILHDYLYVIQECTRREADALFIHAMQDEGVGVIRRSIMHLAVRMFGGSGWKSRKNRENRL